MQKLMFAKKLICLSLLVAMISGCESTEISESELYGTYIAEHSFGEEKLVLNSDGTYVQEVTIENDPKPVLQKGKWKYSSSEQRMRLFKALFLADGLGELNKEYNKPIGVISLPVVKPFSWSRIKMGSCEGVLYIKQEN